jgi:hypothetical protein
MNGNRKVMNWSEFVATAEKYPKHLFGTADIITKRQKFSTEYCKKKGWDINNLTTDQIMEIRDQEEWKNPR